jgi:Predicted membrane protein
MNFLINILKIKKIPNLSWSSNDPFNFRPKLKTFIYLVLGLILFGLGETLLITANQGVSPWTVLAQGLSFQLNLSIGITTFFVSITVLFLWYPLKQKPGLGTLLNVLLISIVIDLTIPILPYPTTLFYQIVQSVFAVLIVGIGSGFYLTANLGPGPRDGLMTGLQKLTDKPIALIRTLIEVTVVVIGFYFGGVVGIGTLLFAFGIGPAVSLGIFIVIKFFK